MALTTPLIKGGITCTEVLDDDTLSATAKSVQHTLFDESATPSPATIFSGDVYALSTGAKTIDLRTAYTVGGGSADGNGLKVQGFFFKNLGANPMTITVGASNGYTILGTAGLAIVPPSGWLAAYHADASADVSDSVKTIDVSGTASQTFEFAVIMG
jgi:hypothetical protein